MKLNLFGNLFLISIMGQTLNFLMYPILAYFYKPSELGEYRYYFAIVTFLTVISSLAYQKAIYKAPKDEKQYLIFIGLCFSLFISAAVLIVAIFQDNFSLMFVAALLTPSVIFVYLNSYLASTEKTTNLYILKSTQLSSSFVLRLSFSAMNFDFRFLFLAELVSRLLGTCFGIRAKALSFVKLFNLRKNSTNHIVYIFKKYLRYPQKSYPGMVINAVSLFFPVYFIERYYGFGEVGVFTLCLTLTQGPVALIGGNISTIIQVSHNKGLEAVKKEFINTYKVLQVLFLTLPVFIIFNGDALIDYFFGKEWEGLKEIIFPISIFVFFWGLSSPFSVIFHLFDTDGELLRIQFFKFVARLGYLITASNFLDSKNYIVGYMIMCAALQFWQLTRSLSILKLRLIDVIPRATWLCLSFLFLFLLYVGASYINQLYVLLLSLPFFIIIIGIQVRKIVFN